ncbi:MAG: S8 family serine peptidase [Actinomycetota bacterium]
MRSGAAALLLSILVVTTAAAGPDGPAPAQDAPSHRRVALDRLPVRIVPGSYVVRLHRRVPQAQVRASLAARGALLERSIGYGIAAVSLPAGLPAGAGVARLEASPGVRRAMPNYRLERAETFPSDPSFGVQWGLHNVGQTHTVADPPPSIVTGTPDADIDAPEAWDRGLGQTSTVIAVVDSGADVTHPDLAASLWTNPGEIPGNRLDDDRNGFVDDVNGWDFEDGDNRLTDLEGHGTQVAGVVGASANNGLGGSGVCPGCALMIVKTGLDSFSSLEGIAYAADNGADIINYSSGHSILWDPIERTMFQHVTQAGVLIAAAAGNERGDNDMLLDRDLDDDGRSDMVSPHYPSSYDIDGILAVAASTDRDANGSQTGCMAFLGADAWQCAFSNWGHQSVDLSAPGVDIFTTAVGGGYAVVNGSSFAAPFAAGAAGLVKSLHPEYGGLQLKHALMSTVDRPAGLTHLYARPNRHARGEFTKTAGRVNAARALDGLTFDTFPETDGNMGGARSISRRATGWVRWPEDVNDVFRKRLVRGNRYEVTLSGPRGKRYDLLVWKPGTVEVWQLELGCFAGEPGPCKLQAFLERRGPNEARTIRARKTGVHYFQVTSVFSDGSYTLKVRRVG